MGFLDDFGKFVKEYNVIAMTVAFIMGLAAKDVVNSFVNNIIMPLIDVVQPEGGWRNITISVGGTNFGIGPFLGSLVDFFIISLVVFVMVKYFSEISKKAKNVEIKIKKK